MPRSAVPLWRSLLASLLSFTGVLDGSFILLTLLLLLLLLLLFIALPSESLLTFYIVIYSVMGEDGSYGGNPCVDIKFKNINIDLGGLPILEDATLTLVLRRGFIISFT